MIRLFQFKNTFLSESSEVLKAEYCVIGYFDGLEMKTDQEMSPSEKSRLLSDPMQSSFTKDEAYELCDYFNIVGLRNTADADFWENNSKPYVFISCIRLKKKTTKLEEIINRLENSYEAMCYTTLDSSDLIICLRTASYDEGYRILEKYHVIVNVCDSGNAIQKEFSVLAIQQKILNDLSTGSTEVIIDEPLCGILRGVIKDWKCIDGFLGKLKDGMGEVKSCKVYGVLGSEDIAIAIYGVRSINWLRLYADGGLMTHPIYQDAFYNIRTEFLMELKTGE